MSDVYFATRRSGPSGSLIEKTKKLIKKINFIAELNEKDTVAIKLHFGEPGLTTYLRPVFVRPFVDEIKKAEALPFMTDCSTIYSGPRSEGVSHIEVAHRNGFNLYTTGAPVVIADGIDGSNYEEVQINTPNYEKVKIAGEAHRAKAMVVLSHFKGHEMFGFGGAIKNIAMGLASKEGKLSLHSTVRPYIKQKLCTACGRCVRWCAPGAIEIRGNSAVISGSKCTGCGHCIMICPEKAPKIKWDIDFSLAQEKLAEYAFGVIKPKKEKIWYFNFLLDITPECDCYTFSDAPLVPDIGILASRDPVSIDSASYELVKQASPNPDSKAENAKKGEDKFAQGYPATNPEPMFEMAEKIGLGERKYKLIKI
ncbi:MAG: DUF362 domain-containing protein [Elusimicrobiota bacterium]